MQVTHLMTVFTAVRFVGVYFGTVVVFMK